MHARRHARRIGVPVQQIEGERVLAEQVVVHHERPHQVVGAQQVEGAGHLRALEVAARVHLALEVGDLLLVDEHAELARQREIEQADEVGGASHALILPRRQVGQSGAQQRAPQAVADEIDGALPGCLLHRVERRQRTFEHVVVEALLREARVGVDPRQHEHAVALLHGPADEGVLLPQVEDVVLVDPRRDDDQRALVDFRGHRLILDQLHQVVLEHHLARRGRHVLAELERVLVGHRDAQLPAALLDVGEKIVQAAHQVLPAAGERFAQHLRVGQQEVRGGERIDVLPGKESDLSFRLGGQPPDLRDRPLDMARGDQVGLLDVVEEEIGRPVLVLEAQVALRRLGDRFRVDAERLHPARLPEPCVVHPHVHRECREHARVGRHAGVQVHERLGDAHLVAHRRGHALRLLLREFAEQLRGALGDVVVDLRELFGFAHAG